MSVEERNRSTEPRGRIGRLARSVAGALVPTGRTIVTREGGFYFVVMLVLLVAGLVQQVNLILLVSTLAAGPLLTSWIGSRSFLRKLSVVRRVPAYVFSGDPLVIDYALENGKRWTSALALFLEDAMVPADRSASGTAVQPRVFFPRVPSGERVRMRWQGASPRRGKYRFNDLDLGTRAPFGLVEQRVTIPLSEEILVYPQIGQLGRRWMQLQRQSSENRLGKRHDRSSQQEEYHGLRDYRSGDSPRWIHWRTSARRGELMVKEFEQENEQELAILVDPWLPRNKVAAELKDAMELMISFAATVCLESCRRQGRRLILGWTGSPAGVCQGQASVKLLHELLYQLAVMRPATEGRLSDLLDALATTTLRDALLVIVSTRPINLGEEAERSQRLSGAASRGLLNRAIVLNAAQGDLGEMFQYARSGSRNLLEQRPTGAERERPPGHRGSPPRPGGGGGPTEPEADGQDGGGRPAMSTNLVYRGSFYMMLAVAAMIVCGDSSGSRLDSLLLVAVPVAGVLAFFTVDMKPRLGLPRDLANVLALGTLGLLFFEYRTLENPLIQCLGHWVIALQLIKYFLPKTAEDDWFLFLLGLTEVLIGTVLNQSDNVGLLLVIWAVLAIWVLGLFFLHREVGRFAGEEEEEVDAAVRPVEPVADPYHGLFDSAYWLTTGRVLAVTFVLGFFFFLLLPRQPGVTRARASTSMARHLSGFDEEVKLGQLGEILENDNVVMSVEFTDEQKRPTSPGESPLFRGVALIKYENGRWRRPPARSLQTIVSLKPFKNNGSVRRKVIWQRIKLEPNDAATLFAMRPILELNAARGLPPVLNPVDGVIFRPDARGSYDYEVLSDEDIDAPPQNEVAPSPERIESLLELEPGLAERLRKIALPVVEGLGDGDAEGLKLRARALESYLRDNRNFSYTLQMDIVDSKIDPVEDFLVNRKKGHCEYFGSALALLLRSIGIPARMINGFKGGDWNELTQSMNVRQKHAHSWVEAYLGQTREGYPLWITLDATPAADREESVAQVGGMATSFRPFTDLVRYVWVFYILGYDSQRQNRLFYEPIRMVVHKVREGYATIWKLARTGFAGLFNFNTLGSFISLRGFIVSFLVLSMVAFLVRLVLWAGARLRRWWRGPEDEGAGLTAGILFYRRLAQLLSGFDLERTTAETQREFAHRAARFLHGHGSQTQSVAEVPQRVVDAFYRVRFGHGELEPETLVNLEADLDLLESRLSGT
ncbi:MAG: transglutaminaseTgpA domain-containing protein [Isosphaeraceae bacterium]